MEGNLPGDHLFNDPAPGRMFLSFEGWGSTLSLGVLLGSIAICKQTPKPRESFLINRV